MKFTTMIAAILVATSTSCSTSAVTSGGVVDGKRQPLIVDGGSHSAMPKACAYRMSGDYADRVPVTLGPDGSIANYPAVSDIRPGARPVALVDGWWLDRRGVNGRSVFTRYTYDEYAALKQTPSPQELKESLLPGARVTETVQLPFTLQQALADTTAVNRWLRNNARPLKPQRL